MTHQVVELFLDNDSDSLEINSELKNKKATEDGAPRVKERKLVDIDEIEIDFYPRESTDKDRINLITELMEHGTIFDPIALVEENGKYYLIDGRHRMAAKKKIGGKQIDAEILDLKKELWVAYSIRYNSGKSLQLKKKELKNAIWQVYLDSNLSNKEIAKIVNASYEYVRRTIDGRSEREKRDKAAACYELRQEGKSIREISTITNVPKSTVSRYVQEEEDRRDQLKKEEIKREEKAVLAIKRAEERALKRAESFERENENCVQMDEDDSMIEDMDESVCTFTSPLQDLKYDDDDEIKELMDGINDPSLDILSPDQLEFQELQPGENEEYTLHDKSSNLVAALEKYHEKISKNERVVLYILDHINKNTPVDEIASQLDCPEEWVRNTAFALLYFYHYKEIDTDEISVALSINPDRVTFVKFMFESYKAAIPQRDPLFLWIDSNMPKYRDDRYLQITRREKLYRYCQREGKPAPWEVDKKVEYYDIPPEVAENTEKIFNYLLNLQTEIKHLQLNKLQSQVLLEKFNRLTIMVNQIIRELSEHAHRDED